MSWNEVFESPSPTPPLSSRASSLERDFCSNFSCCGLALPDLHALLDHFEECHVLVLGRDGRPIYPAFCPREVCDNFGACSSIVLSYPQPDPPAAPDPDAHMTLQSLLHPTSQLAQAAHTYMEVMECDVSSDIETASLSSTPGSALSSPNLSEPICLPPSLLSFHPPEHASEPKKAPKHPTGHVKAKAQILGSPVHAKKRAREKAYKCPRPGCSKAYLNPNGLKYHLEKGTCTIEPSFVPDA